MSDFKSSIIDSHCHIAFSNFNEDREKVASEWKKNKSVNITKSGYHAYFGLSSATLAQDAEFDVDDDADDVRKILPRRSEQQTSRN